MNWSNMLLDLPYRCEILCVKYNICFLLFDNYFAWGFQVIWHYETLVTMHIFAMHKAFVCVEYITVIQHASFQSQSLTIPTLVWTTQKLFPTSSQPKKESFCMSEKRLIFQNQTHTAFHKTPVVPFQTAEKIHENIRTFTSNLYWWSVQNR